MSNGREAQARALLQRVTHPTRSRWYRKGGGRVEAWALDSTGRVVLVEFIPGGGVEFYVALKEMKFDDIEAKLVELDS